MSTDQDAIDLLAREFFAAFTNSNGTAANVRDIYDLAIPTAVIVKAMAPTPESYSLRDFVEPRQALLSSGTLVNFEESELSARTDIAGNVAQRYSRYRKTGILAGVRFVIDGVKMFQFVRLPEGWRISALAWDDEAP